jgi:hypothetical protein
MTPEEQRIAIAESLGWEKHIHPKAEDELDEALDASIGIYEGMTVWKNPAGRYVRHSPPDYLNDLNAMHEVEFSSFKTGSMWSKYYSNLAKVCRMWGHEEDDHNSPFSATAAQRAEAYLKTLNLWIYD